MYRFGKLCFFPPHNLVQRQTEIYSLYAITILLNFLLERNFPTVCVYKTCSCGDYTTRFGDIIIRFQLEGAKRCMIRGLLLFNVFIGRIEINMLVQKC